jgi:hypothetical protein
MMKIRPLVVLLAAGLGAILPAAAQRKAIVPYEADAWATKPNAVDAAVEKALASMGLSLRQPASDEVFLRRAYLDLLGTPPAREEALAFLSDARPDKRAALVDSLFAREEFAE